MSNFRRRKKRDIKASIYIICEDENYGYEYFKSLKRRGENYIITYAKRKTAVNSMLKRAIDEIQQYREKIAVNADKFCVFDCDNNPQNLIDKALSCAKKNDIKLIMNNPCLEFWFLLHFNNNTSKNLTAKQAVQLLQKSPMPNYSKSDKTHTYYKQYNEMLKSKQKQACKLSRELCKTKNCYNRDDNPCSNMYELIDIINNK